MLRTLRSRLILSHLIPVLVIVPLFGFILLYVVETQVLLVSAATELTEQARVIAEVANTQPGVWRDPDVAQEYVRAVGGRLRLQIMLMDRDGVLLATNSPQYTFYYGQEVPLPGWETAQTGHSSALIRDEGEASVTVPAMNAEEQVIGMVRVSDELSTMAQRFNQVRRFVLLVLAGELLLGALVGLAAAIYVGQPLERVTSAIYQVSQGSPSFVREEGPDEMRQLSLAFNALVSRLQRLEEARRRLLANLVHELGRPLGALRSAVYSLQSGGDQDQDFRRVLLEGMAGELARMQPMLDDLAQLHDRVLGSWELDSQETELVSWLPAILAPWQEAARAKGIVWHEELAGAPVGSPAIVVDRSRLAQALGNLISNALKYTPPGGEVWVAAGASVDRAWLQVTDTGPGIPEGEREKIFEPFFRGGQAGRFPQGLGLGLTIARDIVEAHGGALEVEQPETGRGSRFTITLPL